MSQSDSTAKPAESAILQAMSVLAEPGQVVELRALEVQDARVPQRSPQTWAGYYNDFNLLAQAAAAISGRARGVYVTLNPVRAALLARAANRLKIGGRGSLTSDEDVLRRRWLPIDVDAVRPAGISATKEELNQAMEMARAIESALAERAWPKPLIACSGNGGHLLYRIDLPNTEHASHLVKSVLGNLATQFNTSTVKVDVSVFTAARIWRLYGTVARKGDDTQDRPHRRARIQRVPKVLAVVPRKLLENLAATATVSSGGGSGTHPPLAAPVSAFRKVSVTKPYYPWPGL